MVVSLRSDAEHVRMGDKTLELVGRSRLQAQGGSWELQALQSRKLRGAPEAAAPWLTPSGSGLPMPPAPVPPASSVSVVNWRLRVLVNAARACVEDKD